MIRPRPEPLGMVNLQTLEPLEARDQPGFEARRRRLGWALGTQRLGLSAWEVESGQAAYPLHYHLGEEEVVIVLAGQPSLRTTSGWRRLEPGDAVAFPIGPAGAHQVANWSGQVARFIAVSTSGAPDIVVYPESDKIGAYQRLPGGPGLAKMFRAADAVDYHLGETPPPAPS
jgi:uncharacterized cupin superfamily protein